MAPCKLDFEIKEIESMKYQHCLVGVDFSEPSFKAFEAALCVVSALDLKLSVVHVIDEQTASRLCHYMNVSQEELVKEMNIRLEQVVKEKCDPKKVQQLFTLVGHPYVSLVELCEKEGIDLLVLGAKSSSGHGCKVGPIAAKCIRKGTSDVLLVRDDAQMPFRHLLSCIDLSPTSSEVASVAQEWREAFEAQLTHLMVYQTPLSLTVDYAGFVPALPVSTEEDCEKCQEELERFISSNSKFFSYKHEKFLIKSTIQVKDGIISAIEEEGIDLVCLGTKGQNRMKTLLLGTTAERVISHACCSILAVKHELAADLLPQPLVEEVPGGDLSSYHLRIC